MTAQQGPSFSSTDHVHCLDCGAAVDMETSIDQKYGYVNGRFPAAHDCPASTDAIECGECDEPAAGMAHWGTHQAPVCERHAMFALADEDDEVIVDYFQPSPITQEVG